MSARPWAAAAVRAAACSALFVGVYAGCNAAAAVRPDVPSLCFGWERHVPFVPAMIVPYWSIDLFFVASFFFCRTRGELDLLARRLSVAILAGGVCFLLFPLRIGFPRPDVDGVWKPLFESLWSFDRPYNLFPSLHIALLTILADLYLRRSKGQIRTALAGWFLLIAASTLFTWQHHLLDVAGGLVLGLLCLHLLGEVPVSETGNRTVGGYYLAGSLLCLAVAAALPPPGLILLWPATSLAVVAAGYLGLGPGIYGKSGPTLPLSARLLLGPCLIGQRFSLEHYRRRSPLWSEVAPGVRIGARPTESEARAEIRDGVSAVLDLTAEFSAPPAFRRFDYLNVPVLDLSAPSADQLDEAVRFIDRHATDGTVYVHCKAGYSRSAAVVGAWLLHRGRAETAEQAMAVLRSARPSIVIRPEAQAAVRAFGDRRTLSLRRPAEAEARI